MVSISAFSFASARVRFSVDVQGQYGVVHQRSLELSTGLNALEQIDVHGMKEINVKLAAEIGASHVALLVDGLPDHCDIRLVAWSNEQVAGRIIHERGPGIVYQTPACKLRCRPADDAVDGPGCINCRGKNLFFQVCC